MHLDYLDRFIDFSRWVDQVNARFNIISEHVDRALICTLDHLTNIFRSLGVGPRPNLNQTLRYMLRLKGRRR